MSTLYQSIPGRTADPSSGLLAATTATTTGLKEVLAGITTLMKNQESQAIQRNTLDAQNVLKQRIQNEGLGIMSKPIDQDEFVKPYGNLIDRAAIAKTTTDFTERLKNEHINRLSIGADEIGSQTGDYIKARDFLKQGLVAAGAPTTIADEIAIGYDARKAAEIKNQDILHQRVLDIGLATVGEAATQGGFTAGLDKAREIVTSSNMPKHKKASALKDMITKFTDSAKINETDAGLITNAMASFDQNFKLGIESRLANIDQKNKQTYSSSDSTSVSTGSDGVTRSKKDKTGGALGPDLIDSKGTVNKSVAVALGGHVTNFIERLSRTSDAAMIKAIHKDVADNVGDEAVAGNILGQAFSYAYQGDGMLGNNLSAKDIEAMKKKANELIQAHNEKTTGTSTSHSSSRSSSRGGNISFTNADSINSLITEQAKERQLFYEKMTTAARDNALGYKGNVDPNNPAAPDRLVQVLAEFRAKQPATVMPSTTTNNIKAAGGSGGAPAPLAPLKPVTKVPPKPDSKARIDALLKENNITPTEDGQPTAGNNMDDNVKRILAKANATAPNQAPPTSTQAPAAPATVPGYIQADLDKKASYKRLSDKLKNKPDPHAGQIHVLDSKGKNFWVPANTNLQKWNYRPYNK